MVVEEAKTLKETGGLSPVFPVPVSHQADQLNIRLAEASGQSRPSPVSIVHSGLGIVIGMGPQLTICDLKNTRSF